MKHVRAGFNVTCFAYGMTGAGKTHTMFGSMTRGRSGAGNNFEPGIANLAIEDLFVPYTENGVEYKTQISVSFLEIYNE